MIIIDSYKENRRTFGEANPGDCFEWDGEYFMKINMPVFAKIDGCTVGMNAVNLRSGELHLFQNTNMVRAVGMKAEVM